MDLLIKKDYRGRDNVDKFISSTLPMRVMNSGAYYAVCMNPNVQIEKITNGSLTLPTALKVTGNFVQLNVGMDKEM